jgi:Ca-activated chloride channel family protein
MKTSVLLDHEPVADGGFFVRALLTIEGETPKDVERAPLNLSLVLDRSGSMWGEKLHAARRAASGLVKRLWPEDVVSVVAFDDEVQVVANPATGEEQHGLAQRINTIEPGGTTNLSGGWLRGRDLLAENLRKGAVNRVILLTDGLANVGITEPGALVGLCREGVGAGISTTTIGFGDGYDEDLLKAMADAGSGGTYYIETVDQAVGIFEEELEGLMSLAAQNVRVTVRPGAGADFVRVLHDYPSHARGETLTLEVGDLYGREPRRVLAELLIPHTETGDEIDVAHIEVVAHVLTREGGVELRTISLPVTLSPVEGGKVEPEVRKEVLLVEAAQARKEALEHRDRGDWEAAASMLRDTASKVRDAGMEDPCLEEELQDLESSSALFEERTVSAQDAKYLKQRAYSSMRSRHEGKRRYRRE